MSAVNALHEISMEVATALEKCLDVEPGHVAAVFFAVRSSLKGGLILFTYKNTQLFVIFTPKHGEDQPNLTVAYFIRWAGKPQMGGNVQPPTTEKPRYSWKGRGGQHVKKTGRPIELNLGLDVSWGLEISRCGEAWAVLIVMSVWDNHFPGTKWAVLRDV